MITALKILCLDLIVCTLQMTHLSGVLFDLGIRSISWGLYPPTGSIYLYQHIATHCETHSQEPPRLLVLLKITRARRPACQYNVIARKKKLSHILWVSSDAPALIFPPFLSSLNLNKHTNFSYQGRFSRIISMLINLQQWCNAIVW